MSDKHLISIIMGTYNCENSLEESIDSILSQSYENWEFIICDDGSSDCTLEILQKKEKDDHRFIIISNDCNKGLPYTLNRCISFCKGEFIARMDADDISYPDRIERQVEFLKNHPDISFVSSSVDLFDGEKVIGIRQIKEFPQKKDLIYGSPFVHPATMFRAKDLKHVGGYRVAPETVRGQDYDLFMRMYGAGFRGANLQEPVFRYTEGIEAIKRRTFKARIGEMKLRLHGYKAMHVLPWAFPFLIKPYVAWFITLFKKR